MIDEKQLIEVMERWKRTGIEEHEQSAFNLAIDLIKIQPIFGEWIPCNERLPEEKKFYEENMRSPACLVTVLSDDELMVDIDRTVNGVWVIEELFGKPKIIAWQPLPEPYSSED